VDDPVKYWTSSFWHGHAASGASADGFASGDLHLALRWHTEAPSITEELLLM
jgi:hypothetical protein